MGQLDGKVAGNRFRYHENKRFLGADKDFAIEVFREVKMKPSLAGAFA